MSRRQQWKQIKGGYPKPPMTREWVAYYLLCLGCGLIAGGILGTLYR